MSPCNGERRPWQDGDQTPAKKSLPIVPDSDDARRLARRDLFALAGRREDAVAASARDTDGILVAQLYSDLKAAERKSDRVRGHGLDLRVELVRVIPGVPLDDEAVT